MQHRGELPHIFCVKKSIMQQNVHSEQVFTRYTNMCIFKKRSKPLKKKKEEQTSHMCALVSFHYFFTVHMNINIRTK